MSSDNWPLTRRGVFIISASEITICQYLLARLSVKYYAEEGVDFTLKSLCSVTELLMSEIHFLIVELIALH